MKRVHQQPLSGITLLLSLAALVLAAADASAQRVFLFVDTDFGDDGGNGTLAQPYQRLNRALQRAYELRHLQPVDPLVPPQVSDLEVTIKLKAATRPVAPALFGGLVSGVDDGLEDEGWKSYSDEFLNITHPAFPIRMINRVSIEGVRSAGQRPRIVIDEHGGSSIFALSGDGWDGLLFPKHSYIHAADNSSLTDLFLDGTKFFFKENDRINGIWGNDISNFTVSNCRIEDFYDGMHLHADAATDSLIVDVIDTEVLSAGPLHSPPDTVDEAQGHAGVWVAGSGQVTASFSGCTFEACHDGIEVAGTNMTSGTVTLTDCTFHLNENGAEVVGTGTLTTSIDNCMFDTNVNDLNGMPLFLPDGTPNSPAGIAARTMTNHITARSSTYFNNAFGIFINTDGTYDFGRNGLVNPGHNTFDLDFSLFAGTDPVRVALYVKYPPADVMAGGNTWYHVNGNQGTSPTGCLTGTVTGHLVDGANLVDVVLPDMTIVHEPPGPGLGMCCDGTGQDWKRNYSLKPNAVIKFGAFCLP